MQKIRLYHDLDRTVVVHLAGTFNSTDSDEFRIKVQCLESADPAIVDVADVTAMDAVDMDVLVRVNQKRLRNGLSRMRVINVNPIVGRLLHTRGLARAFDIQ